MAGTHPFLTKLRGILRTLDDDALAVLANRGLLRRAQKDIEAQRPTLLDVTENRVHVQVADGTVEVPELPPHSTCSCLASGICRHILGALIFLRDDPEVLNDDEPETSVTADSPSPPDRGDSAPAPTTPTQLSPAEVLGSLDDVALQKWAGKPLIRKADKLLASDPVVEIETEPTLIIRFPRRNISCRWIPSAGLEGLLCSCQAGRVCEHLVAAVMAYQASLGVRTIEARPVSLEESSGAPRTRAEVLASVAQVLREMVSLGLSRLSTATSDRLTTLAISAHGVDLPRLERMLKGLADDVRLIVRRDARGDSAALLDRAARVEALRTALSIKASPALVGQHRTQYLEVGQLTLHGVGAQQWRSKGGYHGVTVYFWNESTKSWATWSDARPVGQAGFDPVGRFRAEGPWTGCAGPFEASRSTVRLTSAWMNAHGRLSGRSGTRALVVGPSRPGDLPDRITRWSDISNRAASLFGGGLTERGENGELVVLNPAEWGEAEFDDLRQELRLPVVDDRGHALELWMPFAPETATAIERLENLNPEGTTGLLGAIRFVGGMVYVQPISLFTATGIVHLTLDALKRRRRSNGSADDEANAGRADKDEPETDGEPAEESTGIAGDERSTVSAATPLGRFLVTAMSELEALAESGLRVRRDPETLSGVARRLDRLGLAVCSRALERVLNSTAKAARNPEPESQNAAATDLLRAYYVTRLAADQEVVAVASCGL